MKLGDNEIDVCFWTFDDENCFYETSCGKSFQFISENKKAPGVNGFLYCPYCGKSIIRIYRNRKVQTE